VKTPDHNTEHPNFDAAAMCAMVKNWMCLIFVNALQTLKYISGKDNTPHFTKKRCNFIRAQKIFKFGQP
jgi:hypothetical protein